MQQFIEIFVQNGPVKDRLLIIEDAISRFQQYWMNREAYKTIDLISGLQSMFDEIATSFFVPGTECTYEMPGYGIVTVKNDPDIVSIAICKMYWIFQTIDDFRLRQILKPPNIRDPSYDALMQARTRAIAAWLWMSTKFDSSKFEEKFPVASEVSEETCRKHVEHLQRVQLTDSRPARRNKKVKSYGLSNKTR